MLSCSCPEWDGDPDTWMFFFPDDFEKFNAKRRKRCKSCNDLINIGSDCIKFTRIRSPRSDIEERIYGDEIPMLSLVWCEKCAEIYFNLTEIGYCLTPTDSAREVIEEYWELTGFDPNKYKKEIKSCQN